MENADEDTTPFGTDSLLVRDTSDTTVLRRMAMTTVRAYTTSTWARPTPTGTIPSGVLAAGGTAGQVLARTATGQEWADAGAGTGDITAVNTLGTGGLAGGTDSGEANLRLSFNSLAQMSSSDLLGSDRLAIADVSESDNNIRYLTFGSMVAFMQDSTTTLTSADGKLSVAAGGITNTQIADDTITEPKLDISNTPSADQVLSWDGTFTTMG